MTHTKKESCSQNTFKKYIKFFFVFYQVITSFRQAQKAHQTKSVVLLEYKGLFLFNCLISSHPKM